MPGTYIGTSGYSYDHWRKIFYPEGLNRNLWLTHYTKYFNTVELNVTFYNLPSKKTFRQWYEKTPINFAFSIKGPRLITHYHRLGQVEPFVKTFFDRIILLKEKARVILWQLPPKWQIDKERLEDFCNILEKYDNVRHAFEFRDNTWFAEEVYKILRRINAVVVLSDWPFIVISEEVDISSNKLLIKVPATSNFVYIRRHGSPALYSSSYRREELQKDAQLIEKSISLGKDVYEYFNNDAEGYAVKNAQELKQLLNVDAYY